MRKEQLKQIEEGLGDLAHRAEQDHEVQMARSELYKIAKYAIKLHDMLKNRSEEQGLEGWVQSKITKAADYIGSVYHNLDYEMKFGNQMAEGKKCNMSEEGKMCPTHGMKECPIEEAGKMKGGADDPCWKGYKMVGTKKKGGKEVPNCVPTSEDVYKNTLAQQLDEKAKSKAQQRFMGMVYAAKKGKPAASPDVAKVAKGMSKKSAKDFASTKHKGKPEHVKKD